ncbi:MerR family transcriptional regulator [bacterium]|nr:MerR family transcriptional regulator [bacterium]
MTTYPKKLFYRINEVANIIGVEPYVLRYWETRFPQLAPEKDGSDQRRYRQKDIDVLLRIRELLYEEKYTIAGAVEKLKEEKSSGRGGTRTVTRPKKSQKVQDLFDDAEPPDGVDSATPTFDAKETGLSEDQLDRIRRVREELGLLKREIENWRDELA